uniref:Uncharacterized protein n=1 Tax=Mustela putorius furo TaxID=9669 RepID=M3YU87_MUSPF
CPSSLKHGCGPKGLPATVGAGASWSPETEACRGAEHPPTGSTSLKPSLLCPQPPPPTLEQTWFSPHRPRPAPGTGPGAPQPPNPRSQPATSPSHLT